MDTSYREVALDEHDGDTMASLISDFNGDGLLDIYDSNDFTVSDNLYYGTVNKVPVIEDSVSHLKRSAPIFSIIIDTIDFNNDG